VNIRRLITRIIVPLVSALVLIACMDPGASPRPFLSPTGHPSSPTRDQLSVSLVVGGPIAANQPVPVTVTLQSGIAVSGIVVDFKVRAPSASLDREDPPQTVSLAAGQPIQISKSVIFPTEGRYHLLTSMYLSRGLFVGDSAWVEVTQSGGAVNPTSMPPLGTPAPAKPAEDSLRQGSALPTRDRSIRHCQHRLRAVCFTLLSRGPHKSRSLLSLRVGPTKSRAHDEDQCRDMVAQAGSLRYDSLWL
jgi:hypothetical protein